MAKKTTKKTVKENKDPYKEIMDQIDEYDEGVPKRTTESYED